MKLKTTTKNIYILALLKVCSSRDLRLVNFAAQKRVILKMDKTLQMKSKDWKVMLSVVEAAPRLIVVSLTVSQVCSSVTFRGFYRTPYAWTAMQVYLAVHPLGEILGSQFSSVSAQAITSHIILCCMSSPSLCHHFSVCLLLYQIKAKMLPQKTI